MQNNSNKKKITYGKQINSRFLMRHILRQHLKHSKEKSSKKSSLNKYIACNINLTKIYVVARISDRQQLKTTVGLSTKLCKTKIRND